MNERTLIFLRVNEQAESFYDKSQQLGEIAAQSFREEHSRERQSRHRAQMTGLENIAETTQKSSDVLDYIKKQIARQEIWRRVYEDQRFGEGLKQYIENELRTNMGLVCENIGIENMTSEDKRKRQHIYLLLIRQFIRQIVVHYEYRVSELERNAS